MAQGIYSYRTNYRLWLYDPISQKLLADVSRIARVRRFTVRRNRSESITLSFDLSEAERFARSIHVSMWDLFLPGRNDVRILRGNRFLLGGQINYVQPSLSGDSQSLEVRATGFLDLFKDRYLHPNFTRTFTNTAIGDIAWSFLDQTQLTPRGFAYIWKGTIQPSRTITDTWQPYSSSIKDLVIGLSDRINSIDFAFRPDRHFDVYSPGIGTDKTDLRFSYPGNISSISLPRDATQLVNYSINRGSGNGLDQQVIQTREDAASQASYFRRERIDDYPSITVEQTLRDKGDEALRLGAAPSMIPEVTIDGTREPYLGSYWIGDRVRFDVEAGTAFSALDGQTWRINEIDVSVDESDKETITLKVGYG